MGIIDTKEIAPLVGEAKVKRLAEIRDEFKGNAAVDQRSRLLLAIRDFSISTFEARNQLDILHPGGRIMELRRAGWRIDTLWAREDSPIGKPHRVARYFFRGRDDE